MLRQEAFCDENVSARRKCYFYARSSPTDKKTTNVSGRLVMRYFFIFNIMNVMQLASYYPDVKTGRSTFDKSLIPI